MTELTDRVEAATAQRREFPVRFRVSKAAMEEMRRHDLRRARAWARGCDIIFD